MDSEISSRLFSGALIGALLAVFFVSGFLLNGYLVGPTGRVTADQPEPNATDDTPESQTQPVNTEEIKEKVINYLEAGPLSYPFTRDLSVISITEDEKLNSNLYRVQLQFTVEANPLQGSLYSVPENQTEQTKELVLYVTGNGDYFFASEPIKAEVKQQAQSGAGGPVYSGP